MVTFLSLPTLSLWKPTHNYSLGNDSSPSNLDMFCGELLNTKTKTKTPQIKLRTNSPPKTKQNTNQNLENCIRSKAHGDYLIHCSHILSKFSVILGTARWEQQRWFLLNVNKVMLKKSDPPPHSLLLSRTKYKPQFPWPTVRRSTLVWWGASTEM